MASILANYHSHTARCKHASGTEEEYVEAAIRCGYQILGFSDHTPWPFENGYVSNCRMLPDQLEDYVSTVRALQKKYAGKIKIYLGLEAEYAPQHMQWLKEQVNRYALDYLIFGNHFYGSEDHGCYFGAVNTPELVDAYADYTVEGLHTGAYTYLAHPDLCLNHYPAFDDTAQRCMHKICQAAVQNDIPLEYNLLGEARLKEEPHEHDLGYTRAEFWDIAAQYPVKAIVGCDAHSVAGIERAPRLVAVQQMLRAKGITVLETLPGLE